MKGPLPPPAECAQCGAPLPPRALSCPECGADELTGWREVSVYDGLELPDEAWNENEAPDHRPAVVDRRINGIPWYWWSVGVALLLFLGLGALALL